MNRDNLPKTLAFFVAVGLWAFLALSFWSFSPTDWPSHAVDPYPPVQNLCGAAGAFVAYWAFVAVGQGVFPVLLFTAVMLGLSLAQSKVRDFWMRVVGLSLIAVAWATVVHHFSPGSNQGLPEGRGGVLGIGAAGFLHQYFGNVGTMLVLMLSIIVGLLLAADDILLAAPRAIIGMLTVARSKTAHLRFNFANLPKLPAMPRFITRDVAYRVAPADEDEEVDAVGTVARSKLAARAATLPAAGKGGQVFKPDPTKAADRNWMQRIGTWAGFRSRAADDAVIATINNEDDDVELNYRDDGTPGEGAAHDAAWSDDDFGPSEAAVIPPPDQQKPVRAAPVIRLPGMGRPMIVPAVPTAAGANGRVPATGGTASPANPANDARAQSRVPQQDDADDIDQMSDDDENLAAQTHAVDSDDQSPLVPEPPVVRKDIIVKLPTMIKPRQSSPPIAPKELGEYQLPGWECLEDAEQGYTESQESFVREQAAMLEQALKEFNIDAHVVEIDTGPVITMYELALAPGIKVSTISGLSNDIQRSLKAETVRIVAPIPGKNTVGIEVPNEQKEKVRFKDLMQLAAPEQQGKMDIPLFLGKDASGEPLITDLSKMPHCLIAGTTGSGKSVCINTIIMSIMYKQRPDMVKLVLFDPKVVEMAMYKDIPHLMCPVINDASKATSVLEWACEKMDERYEFLAEAGVRNIKGYNSLTQEELIERFQPGTPEEEAKIPKKMPYIVIIIDELADLMMTSGKEVEASIVRIAQKARAVGIHLILATQRPSANVVTGLIKSNMPTRIAFRVQSKMDSRIVLDQNGADLLLGHGDMLFLPPGASKPTRAQGTFIDDKEVRESVKIVKAMAEAQYEPELVQIKATGNVDEEAAKDDLFDAAVRVVLETKRGSVSLLQRRLTIGYARASRLIEAMAAAGIVGEYKGSQAREAQITVEEWDAMCAARQADVEDGMSV
ncbi:DNA translocase FtsK [Humisphaera borealis]|uniref:DNA translocase FtsK 4TM domain-containing protein n=1 Tax=Humisphaera borealis TaxID=2807512 RepID=A0A7M2WUA0_9BACT|nr:DNA translocase FtsK [Humisphaera borealis]QOV88844.1 DNA translocase FtsK 4TM domain-containing protein [Humisphaera borealis]